jgi:hypothetical protein
LFRKGIVLKELTLEEDNVTGTGVADDVTEEESGAEGFESLVKG